MRSDVCSDDVKLYFRVRIFVTNCQTAASCGYFRQLMDSSGWRETHLLAAKAHEVSLFLLFPSSPVTLHLKDTIKQRPTPSPALSPSWLIYSHLAPDSWLARYATIKRKRPRSKRYDCQSIGYLIDKGCICLGIWLFGFCNDVERLFCITLFSNSTLLFAPFPHSGPNCCHRCYCTNSNDSSGHHLRTAS